MGRVAQMAMEAAREVEQRPELYAPVMNPLANVRVNSAARLNGSCERDG